MQSTQKGAVTVYESHERGVHSVKKTTAILLIKGIIDAVDKGDH